MQQNINAIVLQLSVQEKQ